MAGNLYDRLKRIRENRVAGSSDDLSPGEGKTPVKTTINRGKDGDPSVGWQMLVPGVWRHESFISLNGDMEAIVQGLYILTGMSVDVSELSTLGWIDTETTGLSTGAGTLIFLFGMLQILPVKVSPRDHVVPIRVVQIFLEDFPYEAQFLESVQQELNSVSSILSYNGKVYDLPLLRTRCILSQISFLEPFHSDLLTGARRLWRGSLDSCSLGTLEREICGIHRILDIPGSEIPGFYLDYQKTCGRPDMDTAMAHTIAHHHSDLVSMLLLTETLGRELVHSSRSAQVNVQDYLAVVDSLSIDPRGLELILLARGKYGFENLPQIVREYVARGSDKADWAYERWLRAFEDLLENKLPDLSLRCNSDEDVVTRAKKSPESHHLRWVGFRLLRSGQFRAAFCWFAWDSLVWKTWSSFLRVLIHLEHQDKGKAQVALAAGISRWLLSGNILITEKQHLELSRRRDRLETKLQKE